MFGSSNWIKQRYLCLLAFSFISSPCFDHHPQRSQPHSDTHYSIRFEPLFPIHQVTHFPFSEDRILYGCCTTLKGFRHGCSSMAVFERKTLYGCMSINPGLAQMYNKCVCVV